MKKKYFFESLILASLLLWLALFFTGCAATKFFKPSAQFPNINAALSGQPMAQTPLNLSEASDVLALRESDIYNRERERNLSFEETLSHSVGETSGIAGIPGSIKNESLITVTFYVAGPAPRQLVADVIYRQVRFYEFESLMTQYGIPVKNFTVDPGQPVPSSLSSGLYIVYVLNGSRALDGPSRLGVDTKKDWLIGEYVNWGIVYKPR